MPLSAHEKAAASEWVRSSTATDSVSPLIVVLAWAAVGISMAWGVYRTLQSVAKFFAWRGLRRQGNYSFNTMSMHITAARINTRLGSVAPTLGLIDSM